MCKVEIIPKFTQGELKYGAESMFVCLVGIPAWNTWNPYLIQVDNPAHIQPHSFLTPSKPLAFTCALSGWPTLNLIIMQNSYCLWLTKKLPSGVGPISPLLAEPVSTKDNPTTIFRIKCKEPNTLNPGAPLQSFRLQSPVPFLKCTDGAKSEKQIIRRTEMSTTHSDLAAQRRGNTKPPWFF